ncbi:hypothetical protein M6B38_144245 [Iris pallida]|uniref:Uncharacterized protein n=1 Tax=Iris pallida TaxID=29817 RepID=A0AAX6FB04_IRIPA|nr:hypothetical protein M6B38_144245 [Iris pallida]
MRPGWRCRRRRSSTSPEASEQGKLRIKVMLMKSSSRHGRI